MSHLLTSKIFPRYKACTSAGESTGQRAIAELLLLKTAHRQKVSQGQPLTPAKVSESPSLFLCTCLGLFYWVPPSNGVLLSFNFHCHSFVLEFLISSRNPRRNQVTSRNLRIAKNLLTYWGAVINYLLYGRG